MTFQVILLLVNFGAFCGAILFCCNSMIANFRTHTDIIRALSITFRRHQTGGAIIAALDTVPYRRHFRARFLFRDPWLLYPQIVRDAIANPEVQEAVPVEVGIAFGTPPEEGKPTIQ